MVGYMVEKRDGTQMVFPTRVEAEEVAGDLGKIFEAAENVYVEGDHFLYTCHVEGDDFTTCNEYHVAPHFPSRTPDADPMGWDWIVYDTEEVFPSFLWNYEHADRRVAMAIVTVAHRNFR